MQGLFFFIFHVIRSDRVRYLHVQYNIIVFYERWPTYKIVTASKDLRYLVNPRA